ncbi:hypothetical protein O9K51_05797 [Purpureocillium lavendulum]|uniref:Uncharacterized protein n=1 Tax=Purpureocillium lavendulum TaxID=1247861 RepID=A0AB34FRP7_9HYPO|nr:hypothetical protein O9K51_05797 [Purpureocillium lavendulum]
MADQQREDVHGHHHHHPCEVSSAAHGDGAAAQVPAASASAPPSSGVAAAADAPADLMQELDSDDNEARAVVHRFWQARMALEEQLDLLAALRLGTGGRVDDDDDDDDDDDTNNAKEAAIATARAPLGDLLGEYDEAFVATVQFRGGLWLDLAKGPIPRSVRDAWGEQRRARASEAKRDPSA